MQLIDLPFLNVLATALGVPLAIALLATLTVWFAKANEHHFLPLFLAVLAFSLLGFVTGYIMGDSRDPAVGAVLPAVLTLLGGVAIYMIGSKGVHAQGAVSAMVISFSVVLFIGAQFGARIRVEFETAMVDPTLVRERDLIVEGNRNAVEVQRLLNYIELLKLKRDFADREKLDLSRFDSALEIKTETRK